MSGTGPMRCPVCESALREAIGHPGRPGFDGSYYDCPRCGKFGFSRTAERIVSTMLSRDRIKIAIFSHTLRKMQMAEGWPLVSSDVAKLIIETATLPTPFEQADNLIRWLGDNIPAPGESLPLAAEWHGAIIGIASDAGFAFILEGLKHSGLVEGLLTPAGTSGRFTLTFDGWRRYEELRRGAPSGRVAFMAMQYSDATLDKIVNDHFRPAVIQTGFTLRRLDDIPKAGLIDDHLRVEIQGARFLIVDLSHGNRGAYWEAGYAEGLGKPVIYTCEEAKFQHASHFDTNHHLTVMWSETKIEEAVKRLKATIRASISEAKRQDD